MPRSLTNPHPALNVGVVEKVLARPSTSLACTSLGIALFASKIFVPVREGADVPAAVPLVVHDRALHSHGVEEDQDGDNQNDGHGGVFLFSDYLSIGSMCVSLLSCGWCDLE
jgi:hypothetical protein